MTSGLLKNLEENKLLLNLENFTIHRLKNPKFSIVIHIGPLLIRPDYKCTSQFVTHLLQSVNLRPLNILRLSVTVYILSLISERFLPPKKVALQKYFNVWLSLKASFSTLLSLRYDYAGRGHVNCWKCYILLEKFEEV